MLTLMRSSKFRDYLLQGVALVATVGCLWTLFSVTRSNLDAQGVTSSFDFLGRNVGWDISFSVLSYSPSDTYRWLFFIGFLNTLLVGTICIFFSTIFGTLIGIARISNNDLLRWLGRAYVEVFRNVPLVLQALFWYAVITHLPPPKQAYSLLDSTFLTNRGLYFPAINATRPEILLLICAPLLSVVLGWFLMRRPKVNSKRMIALVFFVLVPVALISIVLKYGISDPQLISYPSLKGLRFRGGFRISPEFSALCIAIIVFSSSYIGEVVRAGFQAVNSGTLEAARALGMRPWAIMWKVHIPLAMRAIIPPLGNQYVFAMKATTIGIAIGFSDLFMISSTSINQSGQVIEILMLMMAGFFVINYSITRLMNFVNSKLEIKGH